MRDAGTIRSARLDRGIAGVRRRAAAYPDERLMVELVAEVDAVVELV